MAKILVPSEYTGEPNEFPMAPPARSDSGLRHPRAKVRRLENRYGFLQRRLSKGAQNLGAFNLKFEMRRTYQFSKRLRALPKFWRTLKQMDMERTECVPKDDFGPA